jgi:outer membrane putative beta-barrel porin/alpha-amylase
MSGMRRLAVIALVGSLCGPAVARADDALVLPKGRSAVSAENLFYIPTGQRFNPHGNPEDIAAGFNDRRLDSSVFPLLQPLDPFVGGRASIGDSNLRFKYEFDILNFGFAYGVTDRLTVGVEIPYYWVHNSVKASVNSDPGSSANVGLRTGPGPGPLCGSGAAVLPLACPNTRRFTTEDVQRILGPGLPGIPGFGFKRIRDFSDDGLGDIQLGAKYQYWRSLDLRLATTAGVRFPTGRQDDPDDLVDISWSTGAYGLFARFHHDYIISNLWKETPTPASYGVARPGDVILDGTFRYEWVLPDRVTQRVGDANALTTTRERLDRDLGDRFEFEFSTQYQMTDGFSASALYRYGFKLEDRFTSHRGLPVQLLEKDTDSTEQVYVIRLSYSTLSLYRAGRFPLPVDIALSYRDRFAGSGPRSSGSPSQVLKTQYIGLRLQAVF